MQKLVTQKVKADPTTVATVWHAMQTMCREMRHVIDRTAQNFLISQLHDLSVGIWDAKGRTIAVAVGLPSQFLGSGFAVKALLEKFGNGIAPGDVFLSNDPYHGGHSPHLPDWAFFRPIFYQGELLFFAMARAHQQDTGGSFPGGYFPNGYDIHAEGLCIPPIKVIEAGRVREDVLDLVWNNVRFPKGVKIDNYAMLAACKRCDDRIVALVEKYGRDTLLDCVQQMIDRTERAVREEIRKIPDGTYYGESATDDDGTELDVPVWVRVAITVKGDEMTLDFSKSDRQRKGFINCIYAVTFADAMAAAILTMDPALADYHNEGTMIPIHIVAPLGSVVNVEYPATVGASPVNVGTQIMESVLQALSKAKPEHAVAAWGKHRGDYVFGVDPRNNEPYVRTSFDYDGSSGAVTGYDGYQGVSCIAALGAVSRGDVEETEIRLPWRLLKYGMVTDFTGAGRWRGGPGIYWAAVNEGSDAGIATGSSDGDEVQGFGAFGGEPSPKCRTYIVRGEEKIRLKPHRLETVRTGDVVEKFSAGGGGVGNPAERDPEMVREDVENELVSLQVARDVYKVVIDPATMSIDLKATQALRARPEK
jgi:N-methylhydantoinase B